jgi:DnaK suppressor protein
MLTERRRRLEDEVQHRISDGRTNRSIEVGDDLERADTDIQGELEFALLQMRAETLARIDEAIVRLDAHRYRSCSECDGEISERRLLALPFAVRCQACEERREKEQGSERRLAQQRGGLSLFREVVGL